jgi:hypothetical protein
MVFAHIEELKRQYTDKYVVVDGSRPELARFREATGLIKTINMSGRALVAFDHREDTGWYDIELDFLKVVDKPLPKPEKKEEKPAKTAPTAGAATKAAPASKPAAPPKPKAEVAASAPAAPAAGKKMSTADIIAAARAKAASGAATAAANPAAEKPAPASPSDAAKPAAKKSTAEILAAARTKIASEPPAAESAKEPSGAQESVVAAPVTAEKKATSGGPLPTTTAERVAWCRTHDAK